MKRLPKEGRASALISSLVYREMLKNSEDCWTYIGGLKYTKRLSALKRKLIKKVIKKVKQPFRKNMKRKHLRRRASGKNEVTRR